MIKSDCSFFVFLYSRTPSDSFEPFSPVCPRGRDKFLGNHAGWKPATMQGFSSRSVVPLCAMLVRPYWARDELGTGLAKKMDEFVGRVCRTTSSLREWRSCCASHLRRGPLPPLPRALQCCAGTRKESATVTAAPARANRLEIANRAFTSEQA